MSGRDLVRPFVSLPLLVKNFASHSCSFAVPSVSRDADVAPHTFSSLTIRSGSKTKKRPRRKMNVTTTTLFHSLKPPTQKISYPLTRTYQKVSSNTTGQMLIVMPTYLKKRKNGVVSAVERRGNVEMMMRRAGRRNSDHCLHSRAMRITLNSSTTNRRIISRRVLISSVWSLCYSLECCISLFSLTP